MPTTKLNKKYEEKESKEIHHFGSKSQMKNLKSKPVFQQLLQPVSRINLPPFLLSSQQPNKNVVSLYGNISLVS